MNASEIVTALRLACEAYEVGKFVWKQLDVPRWVQRALRKGTVHSSQADCIQLLQTLGTLRESTIEEMIRTLNHELDPPMPPEQQGELKQVLLNLSQNSWLLTTQGRVSSSYLRCEHLLEQLVSSLNVARKRGQQAGLGVEWELDTWLGSGAFGEVWTGWSMHNPNREVARQHCRVFKFFTSPEGRQWIQKEKDNLYELQNRLPGGHPNLVEFLDIHIEQQEFPFLEFDYAPGGSLEQWIKEDPEVRVPLHKEEIIRGLVEGLTATHELGISHRDLKPANIVLGGGDYPAPMITDFGMATRAFDPLQSGYSAMQSQAVLAGTAMYLPPESLRPFALADLTDQSRERFFQQQDVFAVGVLWYQLLVEELERPPYNFAERLGEHDVDSHTIQLISRCLARPEDRFEHAGDLREHLQTVTARTWEVPPELYDVQYIFREFLGQKKG